MAFQELAKQRVDLRQLGLAERLERVRRNKEFISARSTGEKVKWLQEELNRFYCATGRESDVVAVTGVFDRATTAAVKNFQKLHGLDDQGGLVSGGGLKVDGIVGPRTMRALDLIAGRNTLPAEEYFAVVKEPYHKKTDKVKVAAEPKAAPQAEAPALVKAAEPAKLETLRTDLKLPLPPAVAAAQVKPEKLQAVLKELCKTEVCPLPAETILSLCQEKNFDLSLFLSQALIESHFGTVGHRPLATKNIFNVGNVDSGANRQMNSWEDGAKKYLDLMCKAYGTTAEDVISADFQRTDGGGRYATDPHYTDKIAARVAYFRQKLS